MNKLFNIISSKKISIIITIIVISILYLAVTHKDASEADATNASCGPVHTGTSQSVQCRKSWSG